MEQTYKNFLNHIKLTEEEFIKEINKYSVVYTNRKIKLKKSNIEGKGCFTTKEYKPKEKIGMVLYGNGKTELGRYTNHSSNPNIYLKKGWFIALVKIPANTELLVNYFQSLETIKNEI
jgi:hypothetical protein